MGKDRFTYLFGTKGKRKHRGPVFDDKFTRNMYASADKSMWGRVRLVTLKGTVKKCTRKGKRTI